MSPDTRKPTYPFDTHLSEAYLRRSRYASKCRIARSYSIQQKHIRSKTVDEKDIVKAVIDSLKGKPVTTICHELSISDTTFYNWRKKLGLSGNGINEIRTENYKLKKENYKLIRKIKSLQKVIAEK